MKVGDLVKCNAGRRTVIGVIVGFDDEDDPVVFDFKEEVRLEFWRRGVEVINASR